MKRKTFCGKRLLTLLLSVSLVMSEAAIVSAAPASQPDDVAQEVVAETQAEAESVSENEVDETETVVDETDKETVEEEEDALTEDEAETEEETEEIEEEEAYNGMPSKVIGLSGYASSNNVSTYYDKDGKVVARFYQVKAVNDANVYILGDIELDPATRFYNYQGKYYKNIYNQSDDVKRLYTQVYVMTTQPERAADGLCHINGKLFSGYSSKTVAGKKIYYVNVADEVVLLKTLPASTTWDTVKKQYGVDTDQNNSIDYYAVDGKYYSYISASSYTDKYILYANKNNELSATLKVPYINWQSLTTTNINTSGNKEIQIGYQVEENGQLVNDYPGSVRVLAGGEIVSTSTDFTSRKSQSQASYRVRGVYYTREIIEKTVNGVKETSNSYKLLSYGEWSEAYAVDLSANQIPAVTGVTIKQRTSSSVLLDWNQVNGANGYTVAIIASDKAINGITKDNFFSVNELAKDGQKYSSNTYSASSNYYNYNYDEAYPFIYAMVYVSYMSDSSHYYNIGNAKYSSVVSIAAKAAVNTPAIQNFTASTRTDGSIVLNWTPVDANLAYYICKASALPQYYDYSRADIVVKNPNGTGYRGASSEFKSAAEKLLGTAWTRTMSAKVSSGTVTGTVGEYVINSGSYTENDDLIVVMKSYDSVLKDPVAYAKIGDVQYYANTVMGAATAPVKVHTAATTAHGPSVSKVVTNNSVKLSFSSNYTGFQIYKKNGKKYKLLATTTDNFYVDKELKNGATYEYKVRGYNVNTISRKVSYSKYTYVKAVTGTNKKISVSAVRKSKTAATIRWTKVAGVKKYDIYRSVGVTGDYGDYTYNNALKNSVGTFVSSNYELIKTITKASATSYTDKGLNADMSYSYLVVATYSNGKKNAMVQGSAYVSMMLTAPNGVIINLSGANAKVSWQKDPYAKKYEVKYYLYKANGEAVNVGPTIVSTKKTAYTIKGVPTNGSVSVYVRAVNGKKVSAWSDENEAYRGLGVASGIKATNVKTTNSAGKSVNAVKISWKAVSGAAYYYVYRTTKMPSYSTVSKRYIATGSLVDKDSNDNESNNTQKYDMYNKYSGSITGTSVIDYGRLESGVKYYYTVVAFSADGGYSVWGTIDSVGTDLTENYGSGKPASVIFEAGSAQIKSVKNSKKGTVTVSAVNVTGANKYEFYRSTDKKKGYKLIGSSKKPTYTDKKAKKGKTYYYKVVAKGKNTLKADFETNMSGSKKIKVKK